MFMKHPEERAHLTISGAYLDKVLDGKIKKVTPPDKRFSDDEPDTEFNLFDPALKDTLVCTEPQMMALFAAARCLVVLVFGNSYPATDEQKRTLLGNYRFLINCWDEVMLHYGIMQEESIVYDTKLDDDLHLVTLNSWGNCKKPKYGMNYEVRQEALRELASHLWTLPPDDTADTKKSKAKGTKE